MAPNSDYIVKKNINLISRNTPVSVVIGAAGFIGSHLVEELLKKKLQVIGIDNFSSGKGENLEVAIKDKNFHLIEQSVQHLEAEFPRVDYIFVVAEGGYNIDNILVMAKEHHSKIVLVSTINLYDKEEEREHNWLKINEIKLARFAKEHKLNARVLRVAAVYGPRMNFKYKDGALRLIQAALTGKLQSELSALEFSTRALYIEDAVKLVIKSMFSGSTAWKIYDGALLNPIKLSEIREILIDPLWYETRGFTATELPPWPTPNLARTAKELSWKPQASVLHSLKHTLSYFKDHEKEIPEEQKSEPLKIELPAILGGGFKLKYKSWEKDEGDVKEEKGEVDKAEKKVKGKRGVFSKGVFFGLLGWVIIFMGIVYPFVSLGWGVWSFKQNLIMAADNLGKGQVEQSLGDIGRARGDVDEVERLVGSMAILEKVGFVKEYYGQVKELVGVLDEVTDSSEHAVLGSQALLTTLKVITGERNEDINKLMDTAEIELGAADNGLSRAAVKYKFVTSEMGLPGFLDGKVEEVGEKIGFYSDVVKKSRAASTLLPTIIASNGGKKSYLMLLQNNAELRPTGGFIGTIARVDFENGRMKSLDVKDVYEVDGQLKIRVEPPQEIKEDLGQNDWFMRDSNFEPDFPTSARQAEWFYNKESGNKVDGVIALDVSAMEDLLSAVGPLNLTDYKEQISADNLFERAVTHSEQGFFPGSQAKTNFLTGMSRELLNKIFFVPQQNWAGIVSSLSRSLTQKHILVYIEDQKLFSYLVSNNWSGALPRPQEEESEGVVDDFLAVVEANLGANKANYFLDRSVNLETEIGKDGDVTHKLRISYTNRSANAWPGGIYKNRMRIYLPNGAKVLRASWAEGDLVNKMTSFLDYGRTGYSMLLELGPKEQKRLVIDYALPKPVSFKGGKLKYKLDVIKQAGTLKDPFEWKLSYPMNYKVLSPLGVTGQEMAISTDLSTDKHFEVEFKK